MNAVMHRFETILTMEYDINNYLELTKEIFPQMKIVAPNRRRQEFSNFSSHIESSTHVGNYKTPEDESIIVMAVELKNARYVEGSRSTQRSYAKKLIESANADAALIAFYTDGDPKWRLSLVRLDYEMKIENGQLKAAENITPAKRYSYLVGKDEPCHTAITRFSRFINDGITQRVNPTLEELEEAFSVEKVTNEFFNLYSEKFHQLRESLEANENFTIEAAQHNFTSSQFAKKLMGQIVFLYFLQKKGWLGVGAWPNTLSEKEYKNAYYARGAKSRELIPKVYLPAQDGLYHVSAKGLESISDSDEEVLSSCVKGRPWGTGPKNFMRKLFELADKRHENFFDDILEPLFYDALNVNRGERGYCPALHCRIPFLSGGLFEPIDGYDWEHNDFNIPNEIFSNADSKGKLDADGILDIFDRYNFTMSEDEPLEREVAIDPEMLGKVFENLLEVNDRKSKGAFYTPREIVHYMCQESLISYLTTTLKINEKAIRDFIVYGDFMKDEDTVKEKRLGNGGMYISEELYKIDKNGDVVVNRLHEVDKALQEVRVADPAVGSGAFPLGMLNEIVRARQNISAYFAITMTPYDTRMMYQLERSPHTLKYETIKNCIFAADVEPSAVDIAQLRLWLALVIDDEINPDAQTILDGHRNPLPLPNLESNIVCGNSLVDEFEGIKLINESDLISTSKSNSQRNLFQDNFEKILKQLVEKQLELFQCDNTEKKKQLTEEISGLKDLIILSQLQGCDAEKIQKYHQSTTYASKPYVLWQLDYSRVFTEKGGFDIVIGNPPYVNVEKMPNKELIFKLYSTCVGRTDLYVAFIEKAMSLLHPDGVFSYIIPYSYTNQNYGVPSRNMLLEQNIEEIVDTSNYMVFDTANVKNIILRVSKKENQRCTKIKRIMSAEAFESKDYDESIIDQDIFRQVPNQCFKTNDFQDSLSIKEKIDNCSILLGEICLVAYGVRINSKKDKSKPKKFYLRDTYEPGLKPFIEGRNINRYEHQQNGWLNYCPDEHYNPMFPELFENEKIIFIRVVSERLRFSYDDSGLYNSHTVINCVRADNLTKATHSSAKKAVKNCNLSLSKRYNMKFLLAILNSRLINWYFMNFQSDGLNFYPDNAKNLPIINLEKVNVDQAEVISLVDEVLDNKKIGNDTTDLEKKIDLLICSYYGLSDEESKVIMEE